MIKSIAREPGLLSEESATRSSLKTALRARLLAERERFAGTPQRTQADVELAVRLADVLQRYAPRCVGLFWPVAAEFDARRVVAHWLSGDAARRAALPVIVAPHAPMAYHAWTPDSPMKEGRYRIPVPAHEVSVVPDLLLAPCVGFDASRYRLGYGGGYFDRTLAAWPARAGPPVTVGIAYECSRADSLPHEAHDLPLDVIVTDALCY
ncbi:MULTISPECIES: 5-formyltetrahydrofolate cyclo-ligase [Burkholderiaceae]|uniref:5-formyltetrahydrofolate cyclo-ligase n=1 Tax=Burkholderiaceae TaxID=119060 RepID=UPI00095BD6E3|nr:5-formyltetrahydrofolate cyclo-ligase [Burkholderia sp. b13]SIT71523.1 5,10-methenyltetrahydrofolate synthetase [Burkholderia sp. b13]